MDARDKVVALETELAKLRDQERFLRTLLEAAPDFICRADLDGTLRYINRAGPGFDTESVRGTSINDYLAEQSRADAAAAIASAAETGQLQHYDSIVERADGSSANYHTSVAPLRDDDGVVRSVVLVATNVSRLHRSLSEGQRSQARLSVALDATKIGIWSFDFISGIGEADNRTREIIGGDEGQSIGDPKSFIEQRVHPDDRELVRGELARALQVGSYGPLEHRVVWPCGTVRWMSAACHALRDDDGKARQLVGSVQDVTDRRALEARLLEAQKLEGIGRLAGGIAHDFNNMLMTIMSNADLALDSSNMDAQTREHIEEIRLAGERSAALTRQLLAFARKQVIAPRVVDVGDVMDRLYSLLARLLGEHIELRVDTAERCRLRIDPSQLEQVLLNLVTNARDAMPDGGRLELRASSVVLDEAFCRPRELTPGRFIAITVQDSGVGIEPQALAHVFEPFFSTNRANGTGLGLATCHGIAKQNGGCIDVESTVGEGATFTVYLPRIGTGDDLPAALPALRENVGDGDGQTLLVVEDDGLVRRVVVRALRSAGYHVLHAADGERAIETAAAHDGELSLMVTDVVMPGLSGPKLAARLLETRPTMRVLYTSGYARRELSEEDATAPGVRFLQKPFRPSKLLETVRELLEA